MFPIVNYLDEIKKLCEIFHVEKMYLFGSALNEKFNTKSDIDFVVKFKPFDLSKYFENFLNFQENLKKVLGKEIDLLEEQTIKNPYLKKEIDSSKVKIYG